MSVRFLSLGLVAAAALLYLAESLDLAARTPDAEPGSAPAGDVTLFWEAEAATRVVAPFTTALDAQASEGGHLELVAGSRDGAALYEVEVDEPGRYTLWARTRWVNACRDMVRISVNGQHHSILGNDSLYGEWHWVRGRSYPFNAGTNTITVRDTGPFEAHFLPVQIDRFLLTNQDEDEARAFAERQLQGSGGPLLSDDFAGDWRRRWTRVEGRWERRDPLALVFVAQATPGRGLLLAGAPSWSDYSVKAAERVAGRGALGVVLGYREDGDHVLARLRRDGAATHVELVAVAAGQESMLAAAPLTLEPGTWVRLRAEAVGEVLQVVLNERVVLQADGVRAVGRVGLYSDDLPGAAFDDVEVRAIYALSGATPLGRASAAAAVAHNPFDDPAEIDAWEPRGGEPVIARGMLRSRSPEPAVLLHKRPLQGPFDLEVQARVPPGRWIAVHLSGKDGDRSVRVDREADTLRVRSGDPAVPEVRIDAPSDLLLTLRLVRSTSGLSVSIGDATVLELPARPPGEGRVALEVPRGTAVASFRVLQVPRYEYSPWVAPVGWTVDRGRVEMGHMFLGAHDASGESILWNDTAFECRDALYEAALLLRGDAAPGAHIDLITCNQGSDTVNGTTLRFEFDDEPRLWSSDRERKLKVSLERGGSFLGSGSFVTETHYSGFVVLPVLFRSVGGETQIYVNQVLVGRVPGPPEAERGRFGVRFATADPEARHSMGLALFRVFQ